MSKEDYEEPLMKFEGDAAAPILRYNVPSPTSYEGRNYIELFNLSSIEFNERAFFKPGKEDFFNLHKREIYQYLKKAKKEDLERDLYLATNVEELNLEEIKIVFPAKFTFRDLDPGTKGTDIPFVNICLTPNFTSIEGELEDHLKILKQSFKTGDPFTYFMHVFNNKESAGQREFWIRVDDAIKRSMILLYELESGIELDKLTINLSIHDGYLWSHEARWKLPNNWEVVNIKVTPISHDIWYHVRIKWYPKIMGLANTGNYDIWVNGAKVLSNGVFFNTSYFVTLFTRRAFEGIKRFCLSTTGPNIYFDAFGNPADPGYSLGDNMGTKEKREKATEDFSTSVSQISQLLEDEGLLKDLKFKFRIFKYYVETAMRTQSLLPVFSRTLGNTIKLKFYKIPEVPTPRLMFIETYKLTSFPGDYGAGTTIKTFSLLPGEETQISVKTWKITEESTKSASSILDSYTDEIADEFENGVKNESADTAKVEDSTSYHAGVEAEVSMGCVNASASAGVEGSTNSAREEVAKNVMNSVEKHSQKASTKREVSINTSFEKTTKEGIETSITRTIKNVNVSRTLNFTFRQMNQEFHTLLHLTDARIAFYNGVPGSMKEYAFYELENLINDFMIKDGDTDPVSTLKSYLTILKGLILKEYGIDSAGNGKVLDYQAHLRQFVEPVIIGGSDQYDYLRVIPPHGKLEEQIGRQEYIIRDQYEDANGRIQPKDSRFLDGIILKAKVTTMRTDGVITECLLGKANALDDFSLKARAEKIRLTKYQNDQFKWEVKKIKSGLEIIEALKNDNKFEAAAEAFAKIFGPQVKPTEPAEENI